MKKSDSENNVGFLLWQVSTLWSNSTSVALKPLKLTHPQFIILSTIDWLKGATQEEIGKRIVLDRKITSHLLRSLEVKKLINFSENTEIPVLTPAGEALLGKATALVEDSDAAFFASIDPKNSQLITTLQSLALANFSKNAGESTCELLD